MTRCTKKQYTKHLLRSYLVQTGCFVLVGILGRTQSLGSLSVDAGACQCRRLLVQALASAGNYQCREGDRPSPSRFTSPIRRRLPSPRGCSRTEKDWLCHRRLAGQLFRVSARQAVFRLGCFSFRLFSFRLFSRSSSSCCAMSNSNYGVNALNCIWLLNPDG